MGTISFVLLVDSVYLQSLPKTNIEIRHPLEFNLKTNAYKKTYKDNAPTGVQPLGYNAPTGVQPLGYNAPTGVQP